MTYQEQGTKTQLAIADAGKRIEPLNPQSEIRNPKSLRSLTSRSSLLNPRPAFTLIELLVAILIISILAAALLGVAATASESAREAKTRNIIARLHTLLMEQYDTYKSRRVKLRESTSTLDGIEKVIDDAIPANSVNGSARRRAALSEARLYALREMMLMEMPDRWSDVVLDTPGNSPRLPLYLPDRTELSNLYLRKYLSLLTRTNTLTGNTNTIADIEKNQSAECLYMFIMNATGDGEAKSLFSESGIGDTDGDGAPEFLDGWGHPISFLRWASGFASDIQLNLNDLNSAVPADANAAVAKDHDPFDVFRLELIAFRLVPLIYSSGRDETPGILTDDNYVTWRVSNAANPTVSTATTGVPPYLSPALSPYYKGSPPFSPTDYFGTLDPNDTKSATDNIHNHLIGTR